jgi:DUF1009 family protein
MLALIAGTGGLPPALVSQLNDPPLVCALSGFEPRLDVDHEFRLETLGSFLALLSERGVTSVCMAGSISRPQIDPTAIDAATMPLVPKIHEALSSGDDGAIRAVISIFEDAGITVVAAHDIAPNLIPQTGVLTRTQPNEHSRSDAYIGEACVADMGISDTGQACVVNSGEVIAKEDIAGTEGMLKQLQSETHGAVESKGGILFKAPKPNQDRRADLPLIGLDTARQAADAGLSGIVIEAGGVIALNLDEIVALLDNLGMFLWVRPKGEV